MALALNVYKTKVGIASTTLTDVYKAPVGYTGVILLSNISNVGTIPHTITFVHNRTTNVAGSISTSTTRIIEDFPIEPNDAATLLKGKLFLEPGDSVKLSASTNTDVEYVFSILETLN